MKCYFLKYIKDSGIDLSDRIKSDTNDIYIDQLNDPECNEEVKSLINKIMIPYKISDLKTEVNMLASREFHTNGSIGDSHIINLTSPSLQKLLFEENIYNFIAGSSSKFPFSNMALITIPDVVLWFHSFRGFDAILDIKDDSRFAINGELTVDGLVRAIELYRKDTRKSLECTRYH